MMRELGGPAERVAVRPARRVRSSVVALVALGSSASDAGEPRRRTITGLDESACRRPSSRSSARRPGADAFPEEKTAEELAARLQRAERAAARRARAAPKRPRAPARAGFQGRPADGRRRGVRGHSAASRGLPRPTRCPRRSSLRPRAASARSWRALRRPSFDTVHVAELLDHAHRGRTRGEPRPRARTCATTSSAPARARWRAQRVGRWRMEWRRGDDGAWRVRRVDGARQTCAAARRRPSSPR